MVHEDSAATETLKESTIPFIGILQCKSDIAKASSLIPLFSFPTTIAVGQDQSMS
uniref:Uncharacterized protein n=1 Tax=Medicago truncatula TaxID=3880 RepID=I3T0I4_MEDTR|nr:unknown [Medicago truncatula]